MSSLVLYLVFINWLKFLVTENTESELKPSYSLSLVSQLPFLSLSFNLSCHFSMCMILYAGLNLTSMLTSYVIKSGIKQEAGHSL